MLGVTHHDAAFCAGCSPTRGVRAGELDTGLIERRGVAGRPDRRDAGVGDRRRRCCSLADRAATRRRRPVRPRRRLAARRACGRRRTGDWRSATGEPLEVDVPRRSTRRCVDRRCGDGRFAIADRGEWLLARDGDAHWIGHGGYAWPVRARCRPRAARRGAADGELRAPMPGQVLLGPRPRSATRSRAGDPVVVLESMKMELVLAAPVDGDDRRAHRRRRRPGRSLDQPLARVEATPRMTVLRTAANPGSEEFRGQPRGQRGAGRPTCAAQLAAWPRRRRRARPRAPRRAAASCCRATASTGCSIPARRSWSSRALAAHGLYDDEAPGAGIITGIGRVSGPRVRDRRQRRDRQGRHLLPDDGQEAPARPGDRAAEPAAVHLPGRLRRRVPAAAGRGLPRPRALRADLLQPGDDVGAGDPPDRRGDGLVHRRRRVRAGDERRDGDRPRPGHDLPRRPAAGEGGHRRGGDRRGARRRRAALAHARASTDHLADDDAHALEIVREIVGRARAARRPLPWDAARGAAAGGRPRPAARRRVRRPAPALRRARGDRPDRRRLAAARVQGALRRRRS